MQLLKIIRSPLLGGNFQKEKFDDHEQTTSHKHFVEQLITLACQIQRIYSTITKYKRKHLNKRKLNIPRCTIVDNCLQNRFSKAEIKSRFTLMQQIVYKRIKGQKHWTIIAHLLGSGDLLTGFFEALIWRKISFRLSSLAAVMRLPSEFLSKFEDGLLSSMPFFPFSSLPFPPTSAPFSMPSSSNLKLFVVFLQQHKWQLSHNNNLGAFVKNSKLRFTEILRIKD